MPRKLASVRKIDRLEPCPGHDRLALATIGGWTTVVRADQFEVGSAVLFIEIDSFIPEGDPRFAFLMRGGTLMYRGERGQVLRTVRLFGQLNQGLVMPLDQFPEIDPARPAADLTNILKIKLWQRPLDTPLLGEGAGEWPSFVKFIESDLAQNLSGEIFSTHMSAQWNVSALLSAETVTYYKNTSKNIFGACLREQEIKICAENAQNAAVDMFLAGGGLCFSMINMGNCAIRGQLAGPGICGNPMDLSEHRFYIFDVMNIDTWQILTSAERARVLEQLHTGGSNRERVLSIPEVATASSLADLGISNMAELMQYAEKIRAEYPGAAGITFKKINAPFSFRVLSNEFLLERGLA